MRIRYKTFKALKLVTSRALIFLYTDKGEIYLNEINTFRWQHRYRVPKMMENNGHSF